MISILVPNQVKLQVKMSKINTFTLLVRFTNVPKTSPIAYNNDSYQFIVTYTLSGKKITAPITYNITFQRNKEGGTNSTIDPVNFSLSNQREVPIININEQTLINGVDIGNTIFTIEDEFQYYDKR